MDRSYPYSRRLTRRTQLQKRLAAVAAMGVAGCAVLYALTAPSPAATPADLPSALVTTSASTSAPEQALTASPRRVYPYSIVPGGVSNARELGRVIREDKVVAAHYAEFDMSRAHEKTVATPRAVHVSYRKGDKVYWTAKKVMLAEGETLLSDGTHEARARCANQISDTPRLPVEAHGPSAEELDSSVADGGMQDVSAGMLDGQGAPGGFLNAGGSGTAGGMMSGGGADAGSLFAAAASVPGAPRGAYRYSGSGSGGSGSGGSGSGGNGNNGTDNSGSGDGGGGTPGASAPNSDTPGSGTPGSSTPDAPQTSPSQPSTPTPTPAIPGNPSGGSTPGTPSTPSKPGQPQPSVPGGGQPGGEESGGGENTVPTVPSTGGGGDPAPGGNPTTGGDPAPGGTPVNPGIPEGGPDSSPVPQPGAGGDPQDPTKPVEEPAKPVEVPEPGTFWLVGAALALMLLQRRGARRN